MCVAQTECRRTTSAAGGLPATRAPARSPSSRLASWRAREARKGKRKRLAPHTRVAQLVASSARVAPEADWSAASRGGRGRRPRARAASTRAQQSNRQRNRRKSAARTEVRGPGRKQVARCCITFGRFRLCCCPLSLPVPKCGPLVALNRWAPGGQLADCERPCNRREKVHAQSPMTSLGVPMTSRARAELCKRLRWGARAQLEATHPPPALSKLQERK